MVVDPHGVYSTTIGKNLRQLLIGIGKYKRGTSKQKRYKLTLTLLQRDGARWGGKIRRELGSALKIQLMLLSLRSHTLDSELNR